MKPKSFVGPYTALLERVVGLLPKDTSFFVRLKQERSNYFERKVAEFFKQRPRIQEKKVANTDFFSVRISISKGNFPQGSFGASPDKEEAYLLAEAEFMERVSSWLPLDIVRKQDFLFPERAREKKIIVKSLLGFRFVRTSSENIYWGLAKKTGTKRQVTTNGVAGHFDRTSAAVNAWLELIERDAFLVHWLNTISPARIDTALISRNKNSLGALVAKLGHCGYEYHVLDISSDILVPVCLAVVIADTPKGKKVGLGAKAGFDPERVVESALQEAVSVLDSVMESEPSDLPDDFIPFGDERIDKTRRIRLSISERGFSNMSFLFSSKEIISTQHFIEANTKPMPIFSAKDQIRYLRSLFNEKYKENKDYDVYAYSFRNALTKMFDFHVVRVICKALYPMYLNEQFADPNHPRLKEFVTNKKLEKVAKLSTFPHPFP